MSVLYQPVSGPAASLSQPRSSFSAQRGFQHSNRFSSIVFFSVSVSDTT